MKVRKSTDLIQDEVNTIEATDVVDDVDFDMSEYIASEAEKRAADDEHNKPLEVSEVDDTCTNIFDAGVGYSEKALREAEKREMQDSAVLQKVDEAMTTIQNSMTDVVMKQANVIEKNADQMQMMTESVSKAVESQSQMVSSIAKAIDAKFDSQNQQMKQLIDNHVEEAVTVPYLEVTEIVNKRKKKERLKGLAILLVIGVLFFFCMRNEHIRLRVNIIANDIKDIAVGIYNGENVSSNQLFHDLGIHINDVNTVYYDENGNQITKEEYYSSQRGE